MNWKLITVILISLILLIVCYLTIVSPLSEVKNYFVSKKIQEQKDPVYNFKITKKIKIDFSKEEDFVNFISGAKDFINRTNDFTSINEYIAYYFPEGCPSYKLGYFLIDTNEEGRDNYYIPEDGYLIIVNKEHKWAKEPSFKYWKSPVNIITDNIAQ